MEKPKILSEKEILKNLDGINGWQHIDNKISKELVFDSFVNGIKFINELVPFFEKIDHHADMHIFYKKIKFELTRWDVGGKLTDRDFVVAKKIDRLYQEKYN